MYILSDPSNFAGTQIKSKKDSTGVRQKVEGRVDCMSVKHGVVKGELIPTGLLLLLNSEYN